MVITGAAEFTVSVAAFDVVVLAGRPVSVLVTMTWNFLLLSVPLSAAVVYDALVAPLMSVQLEPPSVLTCHW